MGNVTETCNGTWGAGVSINKRPVTTISCIKSLSNWPNEAKNSCVLRLLISVIYVGQHEAPLDGAGCRIPRACSTPPGQAKPSYR